MGTSPKAAKQKSQLPIDCQTPICTFVLSSVTTGGHRRGRDWLTSWADEVNSHMLHRKNTTKERSRREPWMFQMVWEKSGLWWAVTISAHQGIWTLIQVRDKKKSTTLVFLPKKYIVLKVASSLMLFFQKNIFFFFTITSTMKGNVACMHALFSCSTCTSLFWYTGRVQRPAVKRFCSLLL